MADESNISSLFTAVLWMPVVFAGYGYLTISIYDFPLQFLKYIMLLPPVIYILAAFMLRKKRYARKFSFLKLSLFGSVTFDTLVCIYVTLFYHGAIIMLLTTAVVAPVLVLYYRFYISAFTTIYDLRFEQGLVINPERYTMNPDIFLNAADLMCQLESIELRRGRNLLSRLESWTGTMGFLSAMVIACAVIYLPVLFFEGFDSPKFSYYSIVSCIAQVVLLCTLLRSDAYMYVLVKKIRSYETKNRTILVLDWFDEYPLICDCGKTIIVNIVEAEGEKVRRCPSCGQEIESLRSENEL